MAHRTTGRPELLALLADAKARPEDAARRLILADWLDEHDEPYRAELVRLQCERAHLPPQSARAEECARREKALIEKHGATWLAPLGGGVASSTHERGLLNVVLQARSFLGQRLRSLAGSEAWAWVEQVGAWNVTRGGRLEAVLASPLLASVRGLNLTYTSLDAVGLGALAAVDLGHLRALGLGQTFVGARGVRALAAVPWLIGLTSLNLQQNHLRAEGARALAELPNLANLEEIDLLWGTIGPEGLAALAHSPHLARLRRLRLNGNHLGAKGMAVLASAPYWKAPTHLGLATCLLNDDAVAILAGAPNLAHVEALVLVDNQFGLPGVRALVDSPYLGALRELNVQRNPQLGRQGEAILRERFGDRLVD